MKNPFIKYSLSTLAIIISLVLLYIIAAFTLPYISVNDNHVSCPTEDCIDIYIISNGVHTDITLPINTQYKNWSTQLNTSNTNNPSFVAHYVSFGWGDKGFYLETPTWADLKFSTAFKAGFGLSSSAMHITFYNTLKESSTCKKIKITNTEYLKLVKYISTSFKTDAANNFELIPHASYGKQDCFYEAKGTYNLFFTCNTWANHGLKTAGLKACLWTPFDKGIFYHYRY